MQPECAIHAIATNHRRATRASNMYTTSRSAIAVVMEKAGTERQGNITGRTILRVQLVHTQEMEDFVNVTE